MKKKGIDNKYKEYMNVVRTRWEYGNSVLYRMCEEEPEHKQEDVIVGKIWLIGRSYAAAIERRKNAVGNGDDFYYNEVAPAMLKIGPELDERIANLRKSKKHIEDDVEEILSTHKLLMDTFYAMTGLKKRSLVSKYLHFHCPEKFFIYDSRAKTQIGKLVEKPCKQSLKDFSDYDPEYGDFVCRMIKLQEYLNEQLGKYVLPRELDNFLLTLDE